MANDPHADRNDPAFEECIARYLDGNLSVTELAHFDEQLRLDEAKRDRFIEVCQILGLLFESSGGSLEAYSTKLEDELGESARAVDGSKRKGSRGPVLGFLAGCWQQGADYLSGPMTLGVILSMGGLLAMIVAFLLVFFGPAFGPESASISRMARVTDSRECRWLTSNDAPSIGSWMTPGDRLELVEGLVEITYQSGARVLLEGPSTLDFETADRVGLPSGRLTAKVPKEAVGFSVKTPQALIVDLGTEFGVVADAEGKSEVHVFRGEVEVQVSPTAGVAPSSPNKQKSTSRRVTTGETASVSSQRPVVSVTRAKRDGTLFVREMPPSNQVRFQDGDERGYQATRATFIRDCVRGNSTGSSPDVTLDEPDTTQKNYGVARHLFTSCKIGRDKHLPEQARTLIAFDRIFGDRPGQVPPGAAIRWATLRLHTTVEQHSMAPHWNMLHEILVPWKEDRVTWANFHDGGRPGIEYESEFISRVMPAQGSTFYDFNVTESVRKWARKQDANHGWILITTGWNRANFDSDDAPVVANRPQLIVEYETAEQGDRRKHFIW